MECRQFVDLVEFRPLNEAKYIMCEVDESKENFQEK